MKRISFLVAAAVALPMVLAAQQPSGPVPNPITASYKASASRYAGWLVAAFDSIPASKYGFKPTPAQQTFGYIAQHLESANYQLCSRFGGTPWNMSARDSLADTVKMNWPKEELTARLKASFAFCDAAMSSVTDPRLSDEIPSGPNRTAARARFVLGYVTDLVDHWSQVAVYMRLNGLTPPSALPRPRAP